MARLMAIINLTPDSFWGPSRVAAGDFAARARTLIARGADIIDVGAVSTRPGASAVSEGEEWRRLEPALCQYLSEGMRVPLSVDTTRSAIVRKVYDMVGPFIVNDISAGEEDPGMLPLVGELGLEYVAMHKRGTPSTMDALCGYPYGVVEELLRYFREFDIRASAYGIDKWILDPGLGFAKTPEQCLEILLELRRLKDLGHPVLVGAADKRFTRCGLRLPDGTELTSDVAERLADCNGADILRVHL